MLTTALTSKCSLVARLVFEGKDALARKDRSLSQLHAVRSDLGGYFGHVLAMDPTTGTLSDDSELFGR